MTEAPSKEDQAETNGWRNRIVGSGEEAPDQLLANPRNWRIHPKAQQDALAGVLSEVGWVQQVVVNQRTGHLVDGHLRVMLALREDAALVPVIYVDLSEEEEDLILTTLDPLAAMAVADKEKLNDLLQEVRSEDGGVQELLSSLAREVKMPPLKPKFEEYEEEVEHEVQFNECPSCGHRWPK